MGITMGQAFQSNYVAKDDCPIIATIQSVGFAMVSGEDDGKERKVVIHSEQFPALSDGQHKALIVNKTNWMAMEDAYGQDSDGWIGKQIEVYNDPSIMYGGKRTGGVRVRVPQRAAPPRQAQGLSWPDAQARAAAAGISKDALVAALKAAGETGWNAVNGPVVLDRLIAAATASQGSSDFGTPPDDSIPF